LSPGDARQPSEILAIATPRAGGAPGGEEGFLGKIIARVAGKAAEQRAQPRLIGSDQFGERAKLARRGAASELQV
jgi:hypothetical protein